MYKFMVIIFLSWISLSWAANHYVDKNANGNNNGTSWANAWESIAAIVWSSIQPGDIIWVSGGTDSTVYEEKLFVQASGTAANPIQIRNSYDAGHNGRVILDGTYSFVGGYATVDGVVFDKGNQPGEEYVYIKGLELWNWRRGVFLRYATNVITVDSVIIMNFHQRGIDVIADRLSEGSDSLIFQNLVIKSPIDMPIQTDAFYLKYCSNVTLRNSFLHVRNRSDINSHSDVIQTNPVRGFRLYNNVLICDSNSFGSVYIAGAVSTDNDSVIIYNNYCYGGGIYRVVGATVSGLNPEYKSNYGGTEAPHWIAHNTVVVSGPWTTGSHMAVPGTMINNIIVQFGDNGPAGGDGTGTDGYTYKETLPYSGSGIVDSTRNNLMWTEWSTGHFKGGYFTGNGNTGKAYSWDEWVNTYGGSGVNGDPLFVDQIGYVGDQGTLDGELQAGSPAINQGEDLQVIIEAMGLPWTDINGNPRDSSPDIGAYQYVNRGPDLTPPEVTGATILDSVTLKIMFSEALDESTAEDENNYSISNNIDIFNASLNGSDVTLQTTTHSPGSYIITVVNVEDLAGNPIAQSNTAEYSFIPPIPSDSLIMFLVEDVYGVIQEPEHTPLKTIDGLGALSGDPDSRWAAEPMPKELIFDLGTNRTVLKTKLSFYNWNAGRIYSYSISISSDNNNWVTIVSQATSASNEEWTVDEFQAVDARYIKVDFINNNQSDWAGLWEGEIWGISSTVVDPGNNGLPNEFALHQNYPNPFNPSTTLRYSIPASSFVTLKVYDVLGNEVATLVNAQKPEGSYQIIFDAANLPSGIYFYRLQANEFAQVKKMILLK